MNTTSDTSVTLLCDLLSRRSITPRDEGCQELIAARLNQLGFSHESLRFGEVDNLWAYKNNGGPCFVFAGHTDVVPVGKGWQSDPFIPRITDGVIYARGAVDMKASIAAMVVAYEEFLQNNPNTTLSLAFLLTSDEEGPALDGTVRVCEVLKNRGQTLDYCLVGEPTSVNVLGDMIKNGRRGSMSGRLTVLGVQGHIAYPHLAQNPIHQLAPALTELTEKTWDKGNDYFPATTWQVSNIHAGTGAGNVIPGEAVVDFNFRFGTASSPDELQQNLEDILRRHQLRYTIEWTVSARPFVTAKGILSDIVSTAIFNQCGITPELSTTGGTSDARFIAQICPQVVEFGPRNALAHKVDEAISIQDLSHLKNIYCQILHNLS